MKNYFSLLLMFLALALSTKLFAESAVSTTLSASYSTDDNITNATSYDELSDSILGLGAAISYSIPIDTHSFYLLQAYVDIYRYLDYEKLSSVQPGIKASYHLRPSSGYTATRFSLSLAYTQRMFDSEQRDGSAINLGFAASKRITDRLALSAGVDREKISANEKTFESDNTQLYFNIDYKLDKKNTLYLTLSTYDGDIASISSSAYAPGHHSYWVQDDAFSSGMYSKNAYRINVDTFSYTLGDSYAIDSKQSIDVSVNSYDASAYGGVNYQGTTYMLSYFYRF